ncbi:MAG: hypothetical protein IJ793_03660 [Opitutales bacterium]|nr:hypothetical protein [Opitutales bacterium]
MKKVVVLLLLSVLMRDGTGAGVVSSLRAAPRNDNNGGIASATAVETTTTDNRSATSVNNEQKPSGIPASDPALAPTDSENKKADAASSTDAAGGDVRAQWTASLLARNPFLPFGATAKKTEEKEKKSDDDWASKKADELNLQSVSSVRDPATGEPYTQFSIEVISTKKRCWIRSDQPSDQVPFVYVSHRTEENKQGMPKKTILTVKNTITGDVMEIRQQERKKDTSRGGGSYGGYNDYTSSYYDDDFLFDDFD